MMQHDGAKSSSYFREEQALCERASIVTCAPMTHRCHSSNGSHNLATLSSLSTFSIIMSAILHLNTSYVQST